MTKLLLVPLFGMGCPRGHYFEPFKQNTVIKGSSILSMPVGMEKLSAPRSLRKS